MRRNYDSDNDDYPTSVAAAAFAIHSLDRSKSRNKNVKNYDHGKSLKKTRSKAEKREGAINFPDETSKQTLKELDVKMPENKVGPSPSLKPKISFFDSNENPEWMERPSTLEDKHLKDDDEKIPESPLPKPDSPTVGNHMAKPVGTTRQSTNKPGPIDSLADAWEKEEMASIKERLNNMAQLDSPLPKPDSPTVGNHMAQPVGTTRQSTNKPGPRDSLADAWEKEEMASIKERYGRLKDTIDNWEINKKKNADRKLDRKLERTEVKPYKSREKAVQRYRHEIKRIEEIAAEARDHAEVKRIKEELKVKDKASKIRLTGKLPRTCLCF